MSEQEQLSSAPEVVNALVDVLGLHGLLPDDQENISEWLSRMIAHITAQIKLLAHQIDQFEQMPIGGNLFKTDEWVSMLRARVAGLEHTRALCVSLLDAKGDMRQCTDCFSLPKSMQATYPRAYSTMLNMVREDLTQQDDQPLMSNESPLLAPG